MVRYHKTITKTLKINTSVCEHIKQRFVGGDNILPEKLFLELYLKAVKKYPTYAQTEI